jgi:DUF4097 and DUF4098 domain-containing protein YvlB
MKYSIYAAAAILCLSSLTQAQTTTTRTTRARNFNISTSGDASSCAELHVSSHAELAQLNQTFSLSKGEAPLLEINGAERGQVHVRAWEHADYSIETCRVGVADTRAEADAIARAISVNHTAGNISFNGPTTDNGDWMVVFFIKAPKDATLNLETRNQPLDVKGVNGSVRLRATNGPVAVSDCGGTVDVQTQNGPIAFHGDRGDVHLVAQNGPIAVNLSSDTWNGSLLDARSMNGPLALHMPDTFRSGVRLELDGGGPVSCQAVQCRNAWDDKASGKRTIQMNGGGDAIRLFTHNGPVAVASGDRTSRNTRPAR